MLELRLLSRPRILLDDVDLSQELADKELALLAMLASEEGPLSRAYLAGMLWGALSERRARANLRVALHRLDKQIPGYLVKDRKRATLKRTAPHWIDLQAFEARLAGPERPEALADAVALYEQDFLQGIVVGNAPDLEAWLRAQRERWRLELIGALERLAQLHQRQGRWAEATEFLRRLLVEEPWREQTHRQLMLALARDGRLTAALAQYEQCRQMLCQELDVEPMSETQQLYERIRRRRIRPQPRLSPPPAQRPLPKGALSELQQRLLNPRCRLLTLYGPRQAGKRSVVRALADTLQDRFLEGVRFVPAAGNGAATTLAGTIAQALNPRWQDDPPSDGQLLRWLAERDVLLVLEDEWDMPQETAFIGRMLEHVSTSKVVVVAQSPLEVEHECPQRLNGLPLGSQHSGAVANGRRLSAKHPSKAMVNGTRVEESTVATTAARYAPF